MARHWEFFKNTFYVSRPLVRNYSSTVKEQRKSSLFISGKRAKDTFVVVVPHLDFDERFENLQDLKENIKRRKLNLNIDELKDSWEFYKDWCEKRTKLQKNLDESARRIAEIQKGGENEAKKKEMENLERYRNSLKTELKVVKENVWGIEDNVIGNLLKLPNHLHLESPEKEEEIFVFNDENTSKGSDHLNIGKKLNLLDYYNQHICFLKNEAAIFELALAEFCIDHFVEKGFIQFSNPDFTRSALAEGVGVAPEDTSQLFLLENTESNNDQLHLCGGASLFPFCGFHAKQVVRKESLPIRYIASGRRYSPTTSSLPGLYSVNQSTSVQFFVASWSDEELYSEFQFCLQSFQEVFSRLGLKFRTVKEPPHMYKNWESLRVSVQVFSPFNGGFIEVGHLSIIDEYISKRLRMCYSDKKGELFLKVVSGTVVNVQTMLALCLERSQHMLFTPDILKQFFVI